MSSIKCPQCNLTNFKTAVSCKRCGYFFQLPSEGTVAGQAAAQTAVGGQHAQSGGFQSSAVLTAPPHFKPPQQNYQRRTHYQNFQSYQKVKLKSGLAITSMVLGLVGCFLTAPVGLILGIAALIKANRRPQEYGGKGFAVAGIVLNALGVLVLPLIAAIAIPNLLAARRAANEAGAISTVRALAAAEQSYMSSMSGKCGDIQALIAGKLIDVSLAKNERNGYRFTVVNFPSGGCEIHATPLTTSHGTRSFYYSTADGEIRAADKKGLAADINDPPLPNSSADFAETPRPSRSQIPNENGALSNLRTLSSAQATYAATIGQGNCADWPTLAREKFIKQDLADGEENGYRFAVKKVSAYGCEITATPMATVYRSFYAGSDGVIRGRAKNGLPADKNDPPLN